MSDILIDPSRQKFAVTAMYPFLFRPLTLGLGFLLVIMDAIHAMTGKPKYKDRAAPVFWRFRLMLALGFSIALFFCYSLKVSLAVSLSMLNGMLWEARECAPQNRNSNTKD